MFYLPIVEISYRKNKIKELEDRIKDLCEDLIKDEDVSDSDNKKAIIHLINRYEEKIKYLKFMNNVTLWEN